MSENDFEKEALARIIAMAQRWSGCNFSRYNEGTLERRINRRMIDVRCPSMVEYCQYLKVNPGEFGRLVSSLTVNVSHFFRDPDVFMKMDTEVLPAILVQTCSSRRRNVRIWSAACARGEEAYSIAMLVAKRKDRREIATISTTILGTDLDSTCLSDAAAGVFPAEELEQVPDDLRQRYFLPANASSPGRWQVCKELRQMVHFASFDLTLADRLSPPSGIFCEYDLILCRNMFIYCQNSLKLDIMRKFFRCLRPNGFIILGRSESLPDELSDCFAVVDHRLKIYQKKEMI